MRKRNSLLIDLTPLLDVILIILFLVLISGGQQTEKAIFDIKEEHIEIEQELRENVSKQEDQILDLNQAIASVEDQLNTYKQHTNLTASENQAFSTFVNESAIFLLNIPSSYPDAKLELTIDQEETLIKPSDMTIEQWLKSKIRENDKEVKILVLQYPSHDILWRDYIKIKQNIEQIKNQEIDFLFTEININ